MAIDIANYDYTNRNPGVFLSIDPSRANTGSSTLRSLAIGQVLNPNAPGEARASPRVQALLERPLLCMGVEHARQIGGAGSQLAAMVAAYRRRDPYGELWMLPLADDPAAAKASATVDLSGIGAATASGTLSLYIAGTRVQVYVEAGAGADAIGPATAATVNALPDLPVTATYAAATDTLTLTAKHAGACGDELDVRFNHLGRPGGEDFPAGMLPPVVSRFTGGSANPALDIALENLVDQVFDVIALPYSDAASLDAMKRFHSEQGGRWSPVRQLYGHAFAAFRGSLGQAVALGMSRNDPHTTILPFGDAPEPSYVWAADLAGTCAPSLRSNPALPLQRLALGVLAPPVPSRWGFGDRNTLLYSGLSTYEVAQDDTVYLSRVVTTYQRDAAGTTDDAFLDAETPFQLAAVCRFIRADTETTFARKIVVADDTRFTAGSDMVTLASIRGHILGLYRVLLERGWVQDLAGFARELRLEKAGRGQVRIFAPIRIADQLRQMVFSVQFLKP